MFGTSSWRVWGVALLALAVVLSTCEGSAPESALRSAANEGSGDVQDRLKGAWLRDSVQEGVKARRILELRADGTFRERVRVHDKAGVATEFLHEGTWLYDGTNLKRRYTVMNGKPPSRLNLPFATFAISFVSKDEFQGIDHIRGHKVVYTRVARDTEL
jgi:hypothetical protein